MQNIGIDFGTTTSILSYLDNGRLEAFKYGGANGTHYIPSVISVENETNQIEIGTVAKLNLGDNDYQVYSHYKMLLAEKNKNVLRKSGFTQLSPQYAAQKYIGYLLQSYKSEINVDVLDKVVITVPEIWVREGHHIAREALKNICRNLGLSFYKMLSEPQAATVYFANRFKAKYEKDFDGHVLVCDYGGGTLDLSLSILKGEIITILEGTGKGQGNLGKAGVAFDEAVVSKITQGKKLSIKQFNHLLKDFEEKKIALVEKISRSLERYRKNPSLDKKIFELFNIPVLASDLESVYTSLIKPELLQSLTEIMNFIEKNNIEIKDSNKFRIVMVGGFSNFYLVQKEIKDFFQSKTDSDKRFETCFTKEDTALAISKGAALVANNIYSVEQPCPINVGIQVISNYGKDVDVVCLEKGQLLSKYIQPQYYYKWLEVPTEESLDTLSITIFIDISHGKRRYIKLEGNLRKFLPNPKVENKWKIGFSLDEDLIFTLFVKDENNTTIHIELGHIFEKFNSLHISEKIV